MIAVSLALRGTLVRDAPCEERALGALVAHLCAERGLEVVTPTRVAAAYAIVADDLAAGRVSLQTAGIRALESLFPGRTEAGDGSSFRSLAVQAIERDTTALPDARDLLQRLAELAVPVAILSNGWFALESARAAAIGFAGPVLVPPVASWKPSPNAFAMLPELFRLTPERIWHVGCDPIADIAGARAAGLNAVWVAPDDAGYPSDLPLPTERIARLPDVIGIIAGPYTASALALRRLMLSQY